ncbi:MAG: cryptochrome/photolyase family protein [Phycisphaerales bacterium]
MSVFPRMRVRGSVDTLLVVFGDQLDLRAPTIRSLRKDGDAVLMMEVRDEATHVPSHLQRIALFLSAMRHFALALHERGYRVHYVPLDDDDNTRAFDGEFRRAVEALAPKRIVVVHPGEWRVLRMVEAWQDDLDTEIEIVDDDHFLCPLEEFSAWAEGRKSLVLEHFYRDMRKRLGVLVDDDGKPVGGEWNFDKQNREAFDSEPDLPSPYRARPDDVTKEVLALVRKSFPDAPGSIEDFGWPVTRAEARRALKDFIEHRLPKFGDHQDAMWTGAAFVYHALLSPALNLKLLDPREVYETAIEAHDAGRAPINAVEGFVRQIIGWREFIRGVYWHEGPGYADRNELDQHGELPKLYWTGDTDMRCMRECVGQVLEHAYGHHIQRLMVTGNFALIAGVAPNAISDWYLAMYADAVDWVTLPNTLGMVMHADGGVVGTKPYAASGQYIKRMSNYCAHCRYDPGARTGDDACPFTVFYWDFLIRNESRFADNRRMKLMYSHVRKMDRDQRTEITVSARRLRKRLGVDG